MALIIRASEMGFCMGVRRAVQIMEQEATPDRPISSAGEIVHNPHVVAQLERVANIVGSEVLQQSKGGLFQGHTLVWVNGLDEVHSYFRLPDTLGPLVYQPRRYLEALQVHLIAVFG